MPDTGVTGEKPSQSKPSNLTYLKQRRNGLRLNAKKEMGNMWDLLNPDSEGGVTDIQRSLIKLEGYQTKLNVVDEQIGSTISDDSELARDIQEALSLQDDLEEAASAAKVFVQVAQQPPPSSQQAALNVAVPQSPGFGDGSSGRQPKLPQLRIAPFGGSPLKWQEFWDSFSSTIHDDTDIRTIDKFKYLKEFLKGDALRLTEGYRVTADNYDTVVEVLKNRFGNKEVAIEAHLDALLSLSPATGDGNDLQRIYDECELHIRSLVALDMSEDTFGRIFAPILKSKLPYHIRLELERRRNEDHWTLEKLRQLLANELLARQMSRSVVGQHTSKGDGPSDRKSRWDNGGSKGKFGPKTQSSASALFTSDSKGRKTDSKPSQTPPHSIPCPFCDRPGHYADQCKQYPDLDSRVKVVKGSCTLCLKSDHKLQDCSKQSKNFHCFYCKIKNKHHRSLCPQQFGNQQSKASTFNVNATEFIPQAHSMVSATVDSRGRRRLAIMQTAIAKVVGSKGSAQVRLLFDQASTCSFARIDVLQRIGAKQLGQQTMGVAGLGTEKRTMVDYVTAELEIVLKDGSTFTAMVHALKKISCEIEKHPIDLNQFPILQGIQFAEPLVSKPEMVQVDVLIGLDAYYSLIGAEQFRIKDRLAVFDSKVGNILSGCIPPTSHVKDLPQDTVMMASVMTPDQQMHAMVESFWQIESVGIQDTEQESADELAQRLFDQSIKFQPDLQRYEVKWPFKPDHPELPTNYWLAHGRLGSVVRRLQREPELFEKYHATIIEQVAKGVVEKAPRQPDGELVHYLPHHCVLKPDKATTKLRVVYDASARTRKDVSSLNDCLLRGPVYLADLCGLLMRFRFFPVGVISDIEKAFHQVGLQLPDRDVTRFLWLRDPDLGFVESNIIEFRFTRVNFGIISSPFLLAATIRYHLSQANTPVAQKILTNNYVDNVVTGFDSVTDALKYYSDAKSHFSHAAMNLREWYSNSAEFMVQINPTDRGKTTTTTVVLGLPWDLTSDTLRCQVGNKGPQKVDRVTKRTILRALASLFDPCGYFGPVVLRGKLLLQSLWQMKCGWDDQVPESVEAEWRNCLYDLTEIPKVKLPRYLGITLGPHSQLHVFCDASIAAYGAACYVRSTSREGSECHLVFAKSRISPLKQQELKIPRLELAAVLIGTQLATYVGNELAIPPKNVTLWTDSQCTVHWVLGQPGHELNKKLPVFIRNRIKQVKAHESLSLRYVPTQQNPADMLTKRTTTDQLASSCLWWYGPEWLPLEPESWPLMPTIKSQEKAAMTVESTVKPCPTALVCPSVTTFPVQQFSSWHKLVRVTAYVFRFANNAKASKNNQAKKTGPLLDWEIRRAKQFFIRDAQTSLSLEGRKQATQQLGLFRDSQGFLRCSGPLDYSDLPSMTAHPLVIPKDAAINRLLIRDIHERLMHAGVSHILAQLRQEFWVINARTQVKKVLRDCTVCRRTKGGPFPTPRAAPLPPQRASKSQCFATVGIDYMGPVYIRNGSSSEKAWICLFTCAASRAIHLEVVTDMSAEQFLMAIRRFMAIYGKPDLIICDNAKTFHTSKIVSDKLFLEAVSSDAVQCFVATSGISWKFIVELAPWMGGFYERMVGLVKVKLRTTLRNKLLTLVEMQTVCSEISGILNSRPLTYCEDDVGSTVLTPNHFIVHTRVSFPIVDGEDSDDPTYVQGKRTTQASLMSHWKRIQSIVSQFWDSWQTQYLTSLRDRRWLPRNRGVFPVSPKIGSVVLVKDALLPRGKWKVGVIAKLDNSFDGLCRAATVRLPDNSTLHRPIRLLYPVEVPDQESEVYESTANAEYEQPDTQVPDATPKRDQWQKAVAARRQIAEQMASETSESQEF